MILTLIVEYGDNNVTELKYNTRDARHHPDVDSILLAKRRWINHLKNNEIKCLRLTVVETDTEHCTSMVIETYKDDRLKPLVCINAASSPKAAADSKPKKKNPGTFTNDVFFIDTIMSDGDSF